MTILKRIHFRAADVSCLHNEQLKKFCTDFTVPTALVISPTQSQLQPASQTDSTVQSDQSLLNKIESLIDSKLKSYADVLKSFSCSSNNMDPITTDLKDLIQKERTLANHLTVNKSYEQNKVYPKVYDRFRFPPCLYCWRELKP